MQSNAVRDPIVVTKAKGRISYRQPPEGAATASWRLLSPFAKGDLIRSEGNEQTSK